MAKKTVTATRVSAKDKLNQYKNEVFAYLQTVLYPKKQEIFNITSYETNATGKKPNAISAPELLAIVGTAQKLGKNIQVEITGSGDGGRLTFYFVDRVSTIIPASLC